MVDPEYDHAGYAEKKLETERILSLLQPSLHELTSAQIGNFGTLAQKFEGVTKFSFAIRWSRLFAKLDEIDRQRLLAIFTELVELGFIFHLIHWNQPQRPDPSSVLIGDLTERWLAESYAADYVMRAAEKEIYQGIGTAVFNAELEDKVLPFYKSNNMGGFLGLNYGKFTGHASMLFYAGARLAMLFDSLELP